MEAFWFNPFPAVSCHVVLSRSRPVVYFRPALDGRMEGDGNSKLMIYNLERAIRLMPRNSWQYSIVIDCQGKATNNKLASWRGVAWRGLAVDSVGISTLFQMLFRYEHREKHTGVKEQMFSQTTIQYVIRSAKCELVFGSPVVCE